jgi:cell division septation protein DedD
MRKARIIVAFALSASLLHGCDFFRILAGRPTSREIEEKRRAILLMDTAPAQEPEDTVILAVPAEPAVEESAKPASQPAPTQASETKQAAKPAAAPGGIRVSTRKAELFAEPKPTYRYYVMIGTFGSRDNAVRLSGKAGEAGYPVSLLPFANGMTAVGVCPSDDFGDICASLEKLRKESFCPKDACILKIE